MFQDPKKVSLNQFKKTFLRSSLVASYIFDAPRDHDEVNRKYEKETDYDNPLYMDKLERDMNKMDKL